MPLDPGSRVGPYEIVAELGAGGMGEVYRARDARLGRDVALKVLPETVAGDPQRLARFQREAQMLAALSHPHIATIFGLEEAGTTPALVMELVEGPTLGERMAAGPLPIGEALPIARQIAEALEYAHERGIIHRDLKPANVKLTAEGEVKILDFGLAKALAGEVITGDMSSSPTLSIAATQAGLILGTAGYMSPEQAKGKAADRRADIWSFGVVLYEMLAGRPLYAGETASEVLAAVIMKDADLAALPAATPAPVRKLLRRCLEKDPRRRLQAIGEARIAIEEALAAPAGAAEAAGMPSPAAPGWRRALPWALAGVLLVALAVTAAMLLRGPAPAPAGMTQFTVALPGEEQLNLLNGPNLAISPDGRRLVYTATRNGVTRLYLRPLDSFQAVPIAGTEDAWSPFFSPDGEWIGFLTPSQVRKVSLGGGPVQTLPDIRLSDARGASWADDDTLILAPQATSGLERVRYSGGQPVPVTQVDESQNERTHRWPQVLPGGRAVIFTVGTMDSPDYYDNARIDAVVLASGERRTVVEGASMARYVSSGHLIFSRGRVLYAVPFDPVKLEVRGPPVTILEGVSGDLTTGAVHFDVSHNGTLAYVPGDVLSAAHTLAWVDRQGKETPLPLPARTYIEPALSPDGTQLAVVIVAGADHDIWLYHFERGTLSRFTFGGSNHTPRWSPDGKSIAYYTHGSSPQAPNEIRIKATDGSAREETVLQMRERILVEGWTPDGKGIVFFLFKGAAESDIWWLPLEGERKAAALVSTAFDEFNSAVSPDGRWMAYISNESGRYEVYVREFPGPGRRLQVSSGGGEEPRWSRDGRELFFRSDNRMMRVPVQTQPAFHTGAPEVLMEGVVHAMRTESNTVYDLAPDARRFLMIRPAGGTDLGTRQVRVVLNWLEEVKRQAAPGRR